MTRDRSPKSREARERGEDTGHRRALTTHPRENHPPSRESSQPTRGKPRENPRIPVGGPSPFEETGSRFQSGRSNGFRPEIPIMRWFWRSI